MTARDDLVAALLARNLEGVRRLGWEPVFRDLAAFWSQRFDVFEDGLSYARVLGDRDPVTLHAAMLDVANGGSKWRPSPPELAAALHVDEAAAAAAKPKRRPSRGLRREDLLRVAALMAIGEPECSCPPAHNYAIDAENVVRCMDCGGLDPGQCDEAAELARAEA